MPTCTRSFLALYFLAISCSDLRESERDVISVCSWGLRTRAPRRQPFASAELAILVARSMRGAPPLAAQFIGRKTVQVIIMFWTYRSVVFFIATVASKLSPFGVTLTICTGASF